MLQKSQGNQQKKKKGFFADPNLLHLLLKTA